MAQRKATPDPLAGFVSRFRDNVRLVKILRRMDDGDITAAGGYTSRQVLNARLAGRTVPDLDDVARICAALRVEPHVLFLDHDEVMRWVRENPEYKPPKMPPSTRTRTTRPASS